MVIYFRGGISTAREPGDSASACGLAPSPGRTLSPTSLHQGLTPLAWTLTAVISGCRSNPGNWNVKQPLDSSFDNTGSKNRAEESRQKLAVLWH